jgi:hypothetical protein
MKLRQVTEKVTEKLDDPQPFSSYKKYTPFPIP